MASSTLTYDEFLAAVKKLEAENKNVTYAAVRKILGRGSMATLRTFFAQRNEEEFSAKHAEIEISENFLKAFKSEISRMKQAEANLYKKQIDSLKAELDEHGTVVLQNEIALNEKEYEIENMQVELARLRKEFASEQAKFSQAKTDYRERIEELVKAVQDETDQKNRAEADRQVAQALQAKLEYTTGELRKELDRLKAEMAQLSARFEQQVERLTAKYEAQIETLNADHKAEKHALIESHKASMQALQNQLAQMRSEVAAKDNVLKEQIARLKEKKASIDQKNAVIEAELKYLKEINEDLASRLAGAKKYFDKIHARQSAAKAGRSTGKS
jgi:chromosome segregation ATPase